MNVLLLILVLIGFCSGGVVNHTRCAGVGTLLQVRIEDCEGEFCTVTPSVPYACEADLIPSSPSPSLRLKITIEFLGYIIPIVENELENSSVQPGIPYTAHFTITPNDILVGSNITVCGEISNTVVGFVEGCFCVFAHVREMLF